MNEHDNPQPDAGLVFGSRYRPGRDDPGYQQGRLRALCGFATRLADAYARRLSVVQRQGRELWDGHGWLERQRDTLTHQLEEAQQARDWHDRERQRLEKENAELRGWLADLEKARDWNAAERQRWEAEAHKLLEMVNRLEEGVAHRDSRWQAAQDAVSAWKQQRGYRLALRLKLIDDVQLD